MPDTTPQDQSSSDPLYRLGVDVFLHIVNGSSLEQLHALTHVGHGWRELILSRERLWRQAWFERDDGGIDGLMRGQAVLRKLIALEKQYKGRESNPADGEDYLELATRGSAAVLAGKEEGLDLLAQVDWRALGLRHLKTQASWRMGRLQNRYRRLPDDVTWTDMTLGVDPLSRTLLSVDEYNSYVFFDTTTWKSKDDLKVRSSYNTTFTPVPGAGWVMVHAKDKKVLVSATTAKFLFSNGNNKALLDIIAPDRENDDEDDDENEDDDKGDSLSLQTEGGCPGYRVLGIIDDGPIAFHVDAAGTAGARLVCAQYIFDGKRERIHIRAFDTECAVAATTTPTPQKPLQVIQLTLPTIESFLGRPKQKQYDPYHREYHPQKTLAIDSQFVFVSPEPGTSVSVLSRTLGEHAFIFPPVGQDPCCLAAAVSYRIQGIFSGYDHDAKGERLHLTAIDEPATFKVGPPMRTQPSKASKGSRRGKNDPKLKLPKHTIKGIHIAGTTLIIANDTGTFLVLPHYAAVFTDAMNYSKDTGDRAAYVLERALVLEIQPRRDYYGFEYKFVCHGQRFGLTFNWGVTYVVDRLPSLPLAPGEPLPVLQVATVTRHVEDYESYLPFMDDKALYQFTNDDHPPLEGDKKYITQNDIEDGDYGDECHDLEYLQSRGYIEKPPPVLRTWTFDPFDAPLQTSR